MAARVPIVRSLTFLALSGVVAFAAMQESPPTDLTPPQQPPADAEAAAPASAPQFSKDRLEQLVAPIALYPDSLLSQVLMASTYPLEVVEASRFMKKNPTLKGKELESALQPEDWDPSVKALCGFPDVLARLDENLDWTRDLGDAFLSQEGELMDAVQHMRQVAQDAGTLASTKEQQVEVRDDRIIVIEPTSPDVVYVPVYYPTYVYRGWGYPWWWYPAFYYPPPPHFAPFSFHLGLWFGPPPLWGRCNWGWGHSHVDVDVHRHNDFVRRIERTPVVINNPAPSVPWRHDPSHRRGVTYRNPELDRRFVPDARTPQRRFDRDELRGRRPSTTTPIVPTPGRSDRTDRREDGRDRVPSTRPPSTPPGTPPRTTPPSTRPDDRTRDSTTRPSQSVPRTDPRLDRDAIQRGRDSLRDRSGRTVRPPSTSPPRVVRPPRTDSPRPNRGSSPRPSNPRTRGGGP